jgi:formate hydrogenlyase transcriptional activator
MLEVPLRDLQSMPQIGEPNGSTATLANAEREHILNALRETGWVIGGPKGAAGRLGMKRSTLQWKMKRLGISKSE